MSINKNKKIVVLTFAGSEVRRYHRRRMETEAKAKVVTSVWGAEFIQTLPH